MAQIQLIDASNVTVRQAIALSKKILGCSDEAILNAIANHYLDIALRKSNDADAQAFALDRANISLRTTPGVIDAVDEATLLVLDDALRSVAVAKALFARLGVTGDAK